MATTNTRTRRFKSGDAVLLAGEAYSVIHADEKGYTFADLGVRGRNPFTLTFEQADMADITPAP